MNGDTIRALIFLGVGFMALIELANAGLRMYVAHLDRRIARIQKATLDLLDGTR